MYSYRLDISTDELASILSSFPKNSEIVLYTEQPLTDVRIAAEHNTEEIEVLLDSAQIETSLTDLDNLDENCNTAVCIIRM